MEKFIEKEWFKKTPDGIRLVGSKCQSCEKVFFPKKRICPNCFEESLIDYMLSQKGKLHAFTLSVMGPPSIKKPYVQAYVDLPEGIKLFSLLTDYEPIDETLKIGMDVEMTIDKILEDEAGDEIVGYKFRPVKQETLS
jgi:uncharacterized OB-fold protein